MFKAMVWDMDGTLSDTRRIVEAMELHYRRTYPKRPLRPLSDYQKCYAMPTGECSKLLQLEESHRDRFWKQVMKTYEGYGPTVLFPGVDRALREVKSAGLIQAINTNRSINELGRMQEELGDLFPLFDFIVTADKVKRPKPAPDSLVYFCKTTGIAPDEVLFVGDTMADWHCAAGAGCALAAAGWGTFLKPSDMPGAYWCHTPAQAVAIAVGKQMPSKTSKQTGILP